MPSRAHGQSLPLLTTLMGLENVSVPEACCKLRECLHKLDLDEDIEPVIVVTKVHATISIESRTPHGKVVIEELEARTHYFPCPNNDCEFGETNSCVWCGSDK